MLGLSSWLTDRLFPEARFVIDGIVPAIVGALVVSVVTTILSAVLIDD
jgi:uncharacterized membrane protein YvlD (DUF360 family)